MKKKKKILFISDHALVSSGVGCQSKFLIEKLLDTGEFKFLCLGGAIKHPDYTPQKIAPEKYGDDWIIFPVDGYGSKDLVRSFLMSERPDAIVIFTDPRFFVWLWEMQDEIAQICPLLYWHVWDNDPTPDFNLPFYDSTDYIAALSLKTYGLLQGLGVDKNKFSYIPHAVPPQLFKPLSEDENLEFRKQKFGVHWSKKFILFWNNRNARRKQTGDVVASFSKFADAVGRENVALMMHTAAKDPEGQDIHALAKKFDVAENIILSENRISPEEMNRIYNAVDCTINVANNEGFGLGTLESLSAGTPIVVHMTGGLQFQIGDWWEGIEDFSDQDALTTIARKKWNKQEGRWWGCPVFSTSRSCTGSQQIPYIYDDRVKHEDIVNALKQIYKLGREKRRENGVLASKWVTQKFDIEKMASDWASVLKMTIDRYKNSSKNMISVSQL